MKFYDGKTVNDMIIDRYYKYGNYYEVFYINGYRDSYTNIDIDHEKKLINDMIEQATKRDEELYKKYNFESKASLIVFLTSLIPIIGSVNKRFTLIFCLSFMLGVFLLMNLIDKTKKINELKKYRSYLSIQKDLDKKENSNIVDVIEFDKFYQIPLNINTLDQYSNSSINLIKKELKKRKKNI